MTLKKALVTGGTRGIGAAIATQLLENGYQVWVSGTKNNSQPPKGCNKIVSDFSELSAVNGLANEIAALELSVLVNNASTTCLAPVETYKTEDFERLVHVNLIAPFILIKTVLPSMLKKKFGRIVNITSVFSQVSLPLRSTYSATKSGLVGFSRTLALEVAKDNILVNCLAPGFVNTDLVQKNLGVNGTAEILQKIPMGRLAEPIEIARYAAFLASDQNTYMTGQNLIVDGGYTLE